MTTIYNGAHSVRTRWLNIVQQMYLIGAAMTSSFSLSLNVPVSLYTAVHGNPTQHSLIFCKLRNFLAHALVQWADILSY
jgi:hypothetical protein